MEAKYKVVVAAFIRGKPLAAGPVVSVGDRLVITSRNGSVNTIAEWTSDGNLILWPGRGATARAIRRLFTNLGSL